MKLPQSSLEIPIRTAVIADIQQICDMYFQDLGGEFAALCGKFAYKSYLRKIINDQHGILCVATANDRQILGFASAIINNDNFNREWIRQHIFWLAPYSLFKSLWSKNLRLYLRQKLFNIKTARSSNSAQISKMQNDDTAKTAKAMCLIVTENLRGGTADKNLAAELMLYREKLLKQHGIQRLYAYINSDNLSSVYMHIVNKWHIKKLQAFGCVAIKDL